MFAVLASQLPLPYSTTVLQAPGCSTVVSIQTLTVANFLTSLRVLSRQWIFREPKYPGFDMPEPVGLPELSSG